MIQSFESADQLQAYQARLMDVRQALELAWDNLNRCPPLAINRLHPNRRRAIENIERLMVECMCLCRMEAQHVYYFDDDDTPADERPKAEQ